MRKTVAQCFFSNVNNFKQIWLREAAMLHFSRQIVYWSIGSNNRRWKLWINFWSGRLFVVILKNVSLVSVSSFPSRELLIVLSKLLDYFNNASIFFASMIFLFFLSQFIDGVLLLLHNNKQLCRTTQPTNASVGEDLLYIIITFFFYAKSMNLVPIWFITKVWFQF
jgi:hypothetical protein